MDISFWIQCNPKISIEHTTKKYFGQYLYKIVMYAPASRLIHSKGSITEDLQYRRSFNHGGSWRYKRMMDNSNNADIKFLEKMRDVKHDKSLNVKLRAEEPRIQVYADSEQELQTVINRHLLEHQHYIESISGPKDAASAAILNDGAILKKNDLGYKYKIILKDGRYDSKTKNQLVEYLSNLGPDLIRIPKGTYDMLSKNSTYMWNCYFYSNDRDINLFVVIAFRLFLYLGP